MVYMYHSFLIHSSADGHLGCFHVPAMINSAAMNIGVHVSLSDLVSLVNTLSFFNTGRKPVLKHLCFFNVSWSFLYIINTGWCEFCLLFTKSSICEQIDSTSIYTIIQLVQSRSCVQLFVTPWTEAHQTSLFITNSQSLCKLMSIESVMPCNFLILCYPLLPPSIFNLIISFH